jgi:class 3 adenylate cyclase/predicted ATPase
MICSNCGAENRGGGKFCAQCGYSLALACPACGTPVESNDKFCSECGHTLKSVGRGPTSVPATVPASERRLVSVLFADLVGFTTLSEARDPEEVRELLTAYFDTCRRLVKRYGGTVEKFIGDAVMAVWGTPVATEDDAERAVRAALELTSAVSALGNTSAIPELRARAAVVTGEAAVNLSAEGQGMVAGDVVNTASRVQSLAEPGQVLVDASTRRATESAVAYENGRKHALKGKSEPVPLWRALRVVSLRGGALRSAGLEAPFVGREPELRLIKELFHATAAESRAQHVSVRGIAGIGKSRLSWEFLKYVDGLADTVWWHRGRSLSYGQGIAYWALTEMVRMRAGILEDEDAGSARVKLRATLLEHIPDPDERRWLEPRVGHLVGLDESHVSDREGLFSAWRVFFERMSERHPTVLVFEDMQWADEGLLDFITHLLDWSRNHPLFILTLARPEVAEKRSEWAISGRSFASLYLEPLPAEAMGNLLRGLVPGLPDDLHHSIMERAEGVPLYAIETVRMLIDRGLLVREGNVYRPTGPVERLDVPETLQALIAARLDGLTPHERRLIQDGSVLGKTFTLPGPSHLSGLPTHELEPVAASLVRKEVLTVHADPRSPERGQYGFLQDLVKRVAYETLGKRERRAKHLAAASFFEANQGDEEEFVEVVAAHYLEAYREAPGADDAPQIRAKAREMLARAGERTASLAAPAEAERHFFRASELADRDDHMAYLLEQAAHMAYQSGRLDEARSHYEQAMTILVSLSSDHAAARVSARLAEIEWEQGRLVEPVNRMEQAFAVLSDEDPDEDLATLAAQLGRLHFFKGEMDIAKRRLETALEIAEPLGLPEVVSQALNTKAIVLTFQGRSEEAMALLTHALKVALNNELSVAALRAYVNLSELLFRRDHLQDSLDNYEEGLALARRVGNRVWDTALRAEMTFPLYITGRWDAAVERTSGISGPDLARADIVGPLLSLPSIHVNRGEIDRARQITADFARYEESEDIQERAAHAIARSVIHAFEGRWREGLRAADDAASMGRQIGPDSQIFKMGLDHALDAAFALHDLPQAEDLLARIDALRPAEITPMLRAVGDRARARLSILSGQLERVEADYKGSVGLFREVGAPYWLAVTLVELGEWLLAQGRAQDAEPLLAEAARVFDDLQAHAWAARAAAATSSLEADPETAS